MKRAIITIDEQGRVHFPDTNPNDIWMSTQEVVELLGVTFPTLKSNIRAIYKSGIVKEYETERYITLPNGNGVDIYSLRMIMALAFRIDTPETYRLRESIFNRLYQRRTHPDNLMMYIAPHNTLYPC
ncbi:hypothetical protein F3C88_26530 [Bacteroides ovatus]|uniref:Virulence protein n=1 Tax=Parabacteroides distasonis TaxID=823 RepID=A0A174XFV0_PARDI|nr:hypothetical protein F3C88_26530 [Bacteroides ovatus]CUQ55738.1 Virulence protein [Parabacteroides distasonis]